jgi:beta-glucosidase
VSVARNANRIVLAIGDTEQTSREGWAKAVEQIEYLTYEGVFANFTLVLDFSQVRERGAPIKVQISAAANAMLEGWYLGEQGGNAVADILFGDVNPGGKLPVTIPRSVGQLPMFYNVKPSARRGYLFDSVEPLYPFGFGLSYTSFEIGAPRLSSDRIAANGSVTVSVPKTPIAIRTYVTDVTPSARYIAFGNSRPGPSRNSRHSSASP